MATIPILLAAAPSETTRSVADLLSSQTDMEIIEATPSRGVELLSLVRRTEAEVLVVESNPLNAAPLCAQVLSQYPYLVILAINADARTITLNRLKVESQILPSSSLERLPSAVRVAVES